jgi:hypothetical protein
MVYASRKRKPFSAFSLVSPLPHTLKPILSALFPSLSEIFEAPKPDLKISFSLHFVLLLSL